MEGERGGDQEGDSWKPQREVRRECDSHKAARSLSTLQGVARQERVQNPSTSPGRTSQSLNHTDQLYPKGHPRRQKQGNRAEQRQLQSNNTQENRHSTN